MGVISQGVDKYYLVLFSRHRNENNNLPGLFHVKFLFDVGSYLFVSPT